MIYRLMYNSTRISSPVWCRVYWQGMRWVLQIANIYNMDEQSAPFCSLIFLCMKYCLYIMLEIWDGKIISLIIIWAPTYVILSLQSNFDSPQTENWETVKIHNLIASPKGFLRLANTYFSYWILWIANLSSFNLKHNLTPLCPLSLLSSPFFLSSPLILFLLHFAKYKVKKMSCYS